MTDERSMSDRDPETSSESDEAPEDDTSAGGMAADLRAQLGARQEVETLLAEASEARRTAAAEADDVLAQAQRVADELTEGVRQDAERETQAARERAAEIVATAQAEADEIRGKVEAERAAARAAADAELQQFREQARVRASDEARAEFDALRRETALLLVELEERFGTVRSALTEAESAVRSTLERLDQLRAGRGELADGPSEPLGRRAPGEMAEVGSEQRNGDKRGSKETRRLGWVFRHQS